jgi:hypothetical protein
LLGLVLIVFVFIFFRAVLPGLLFLGLFLLRIVLFLRLLV